MRNFLARNNMKAMQVGDLGFFYHSNIGLDVVGILKVIALAHPDPSDDTGKWECVDVIAVADIPKPVSLADVKATPKLAQDEPRHVDAAFRAAGDAWRNGGSCARWAASIRNP